MKDRKWKITSYFCPKTNVLGVLIYSSWSLLFALTLATITRKILAKPEQSWQWKDFLYLQKLQEFMSLKHRVQKEPPLQSTYTRTLHI